MNALVPSLTPSVLPVVSVFYRKHRLALDIPTTVSLLQVDSFVRVAGMSPSPVERQLAEIAPLGDPVRRRLFAYVVGRPDVVGREEAARAVGISRPAAAFHLEKLVDGGLLEAGYRRLSGRGGPGAGRPARVYWRPAREVHIDVPPRDYELVARFLLRGLDTGGSEKVIDQAREAAREFGRELGAEARLRAGRRPTHDRLRSALRTVLEERGFESQLVNAELCLRNCPFDSLSDVYRDLVCPMNLAMMQGMLEGLGASGLEAAFEPRPERCCVVFKPTTAAARGARTGEEP
jgi:predicted ArsR family transcriptional regulator